MRTARPGHLGRQTHRRYARNYVASQGRMKTSDSSRIPLVVLAGARPNFMKVAPLMEVFSSDHEVFSSTRRAPGVSRGAALAQAANARGLAENQQQRSFPAFPGIPQTTVCSTGSRWALTRVKSRYRTAPSDLEKAGFRLLVRQFWRAKQCLL